MSSRSSAANSGRTSKSGTGSKPIANLVILSISLFAFIRLSVSRGWIDWPPAQMGAILTSFAGLIALTGPWILYRHEESTGTMGVGDRVWITSGLVLWIALLANLTRGRLPNLQSVTSTISPEQMAVLAVATVIGGLLTRPSVSRWTWTNITGWLLTFSWLAAAALPTNNSILSLVALGAW